MMATGPRAARGRTNAGESVGCIGLAGRRRSKRLDIFRRSILRNVAHLAERVRCDKPPVTPPPVQSNNTQFRYRGENHLANEVNKDNLLVVSGIKVAR